MHHSDYPHGPSIGGRHDDSGFRFTAAYSRPNDGGREALHKLLRVFVIGTLTAAALFYGLRFYLGNSSEIKQEVAQWVGHLPWRQAGGSNAPQG